MHKIYTHIHMKWIIDCILMPEDQCKSVKQTDWPEKKSLTSYDTHSEQTE